MRMGEAMASGALPVLLDDWTNPFDLSAPFAIRWSLAHGELNLLIDILEHIVTKQPGEVVWRIQELADFLAHHHPIWRSARFLHMVLTQRLKAVKCTEPGGWDDAPYVQPCNCFYPDCECRFTHSSV